MVDRFVGTRVKRVEDPRLLTGQGRFADDVSFPGMLHAAFLRSVHPHATIRSIDTSAAEALDGVVAVVTGEQMAEWVQPMQQVGPPNLRTPQFYPMATTKARYVGDPVAVVVAESRYIAEDGCDLIDVDYEPLAPVTSVDEAIATGAALLYDELGENIGLSEQWDYGDIDTAFAEADRVITQTFRQHRYANVPMETRGGVAHFVAATDELTYHASHKSPHALRFQISRLIGHPEHSTNVVTGDVGGAFGQKGVVGREDIAVCALAKHLGRSVKWIEDRSENLMAGGQAREDTLDV